MEHTDMGQLRDGQRGLVFGIDEAGAMGRRLRDMGISIPRWNASTTAPSATLPLTSSGGRSSPCAGRTAAGYR